jgi:hypothetical protein
MLLFECNLYAETLFESFWRSLSRAQAAHGKLRVKELGSKKILWQRNNLLQNSMFDSHISPESIQANQIWLETTVESRCIPPQILLL